MGGLLDDLYDLKPKYKLAFQGAGALVAMVMGNISLGAISLPFGISIDTGLLSFLVSFVWIVGVTNAINLIDGIDGLASGLCIVALGMFGVTFALEGQWMYTLLAFICVGVIIPFFCYNVFGNVEKGHKIFMGDTGSLTLGFILSMMVMKYCMHTSGTEEAVDGAPLVTAFRILLVPCLDVCRVVLGRVRRKVNPFKPDRTHLHHKFLALGLNARRSMLCIQLMAVSFIVVTYVLINIGVNANIVFVLNIVVWTLANMMFSKKIKNQKG